METPTFYKMHRGMFQVWKKFKPYVIEFLYVESTNERYKNEIIRAVEYFAGKYCAFKLLEINEHQYIAYPKVNFQTSGVIIVQSEYFKLLIDWFNNPAMPYHRLSWFNQFKITQHNFNPFTYDPNDFWGILAQYIRGITLNLMINISEKDIDDRDDE